MRTIIKILGTLAAALAVLLVVQYYLGLMNDSFSGADGMAVVGVQLYIGIMAGASLLLGLIARFLDRRANLPGSKWSNALILIGIAAGLLLFVSPYVFG